MPSRGTDIQSGRGIAEDPGIEVRVHRRGQSRLAPVRGEDARGRRPDPTLFAFVGGGDPGQEIAGDPGSFPVEDPQCRSGLSAIDPRQHGSELGLLQRGGVQNRSQQGLGPFGPVVDTGLAVAPSARQPGRAHETTGDQ